MSAKQLSRESARHANRASTPVAVPDLHPPGAARRERVTLALLAAVVALAVTVTHWSALSAQSLWLDDNEYLTDNTLVQNPSWASAGRFLTEVLEPSTVHGYYQPLTMISLMLDYAVGGQPNNLEPFHRTSLALHVLNTVLIAVLLYRLFRQPWPAALGALLFGVHPLTVEVIPWITERKTVLATFFALASLILYVGYARRKDRRQYIGFIALGTAALLAKPTTTPLPLLMLLLDFWPLRRLSLRTVWEKVPLLTLAAVSAVITFVSQQRTAVIVLPTDYDTSRLPLVIGHNIVFYLSKIVWPVNLTSYYPFPEPLGLANSVVRAGVIGTLLLVLALLVSLRWTRALFTGWLFFFVAIFPTLGVIGFTSMIACDKYTYLPLVGLLLPLTALLAWLWQSTSSAYRLAWRAGVLVVVLVAAMSAATATRGYLAVWQSSDLLFAHMLALAPRAPLLHNNYGVVLAGQGRLAEALQEYQTATRLKSDYWEARTNTGIVLRDLGRLDEAVAEFRSMVAAAPRSAVAHFNLANALVRQEDRTEAYAEFAAAVALKPAYSEAYTNWGVALVQAGQHSEAIRRLKTALELNPADAVAHFNLGLALAEQGQPEAAIQQYEAAMRLKSAEGQVYTNMGLALARVGRLQDAVQSFRQALELDPNDALAHLNLGVLAAQAKRPQIAEEQFRTVLKADPQNVEANNNLGTLLVQEGRAADGIPYLSEAVRLRPEHANAHYMLGVALAAQGRHDEAVGHFERAIELQPADAEAREQLALACATLGRYEAAADVAEHALEVARAAKNGALARRLEELIQRYRPSTTAPATATAPATSQSAERS